jgi:hypothetical protein
MTLYGKGFFIWQIPKCEGGSPSAIAAKAASAGLSHVLIKIADGANWPYNFDTRANVDLVPPVLEALRNVGVSVWGWHYVRGSNPIGEAQLAIRRVRELGVEGYVIDAEGEYRRRGMGRAAKRFMRELRSELPDVPMALSTYRFPRRHLDFPYAEFLEGCDFAMPQVYFEQAHNPEEQLALTVEQYMALQPARPVFPTAPAYASGGWRPTPDEIKRFLTKARDLGLTGANAWSWDFASRPLYTDLWDAVASFHWPPTPPVPTAEAPEHLIELLNGHDPTAVAAFYCENAAHVTGLNTSVGTPAITDWYKTLFTAVLPNATFQLTGKNGEGNSMHFTWTATSDKGPVTNGNDTLGLYDGQILYHYTFFTVAQPEDTQTN